LDFRPIPSATFLYGHFFAFFGGHWLLSRLFKMLIVPKGEAD